MDETLLLRLLEQSSGVIISVILILRVERRLDDLVKRFEEFTERILNELAKRET